MSSRGPLRMWVGVFAIVAAIATLGVFASRALFEPEKAKPVAAAHPPAVAEVIGAQVLSVEGRVEKGSADGKWVQIEKGEQLLPEDSLRTDDAGRAELAIGEKSKLTVGESSQLKVRELSRALHQVQLTRGRITAHYDADGERVLRIEDEKGHAVAQARAAGFSVLSNGQALAVATETGKVNLEAEGKTVEVGPGTQAIARAGEPPSAATPISAEVLLKLARSQANDATLCAVIEGDVDPGSQVEVEGSEVTVERDGHFRAEVSRKPGQAAARVEVRDVSGRRREQQVTCSREPRPPPVKLKMRWTATDAG